MQESIHARVARRGGTFTDEAGAVAIITAVTLTVLLLVSAVVIDLASLRADRISSKSVADLAATAAAVEYDPVARGSARAACLEAVDFVRANLGDQAFTPVVSCESQFPDVASTDVCDTASWNPARTASYVGGDFELEITIPVFDNDPLMGSQASLADYDDAFDGDPCDRVGVRVTRDRGFTLAQVGGFAGAQTTQGSVARWRVDGSEDVFASLIVLQRNGCNTLRTSGQGRVNVTDGPFRTDPVTGEEIPTPGTITVDTLAASCNPTATGSNAPVINVSGNDISFVRASGNILMEGLRQSNPQPQLYQVARVTSGFLAPQPRSGELITRQPIDHRYNCLPDYASSSGQRWSPFYSAGSYVPQSIENCTANLLLKPDSPAAPPPSPPPPYIKLLVDAYQVDFGASDIPAIGEAQEGDPYGDWLVYPRDVPDGDCKAGSGIFGPNHQKFDDRSGRHWYIDCDASGNDTFSPKDITFQDVETVVSRNWIDVNGDAFGVIGTEERGAILYLQGLDNTGNGKNQNRGIERGSQSTIRFDNTFVYSHNGWIDIIGGSGASDGAAVRWNASSRSIRSTCPSDDDDTGFNGVPTAGCFAPLALWSNSRFEHGMGGNAALDVRGILFTPNADPFNLSGQAPQTLTGAQFFSNRFEVSGQAAIELSPDDEFNDPIQLGGQALIR